MREYARRLSRVGPAVVAMLVAVLALAACGSDDDSSTTGSSTSGGDSQKEVRLAVLTPVQANPYMASMLSGIDRIAGKENATVRISNANFAPQAQVAQCQDVVSGRTADAMIIHPVIGSSVIPCVKRAIEAGIPVVAMDSPIGPRYDTAEAQVDGLAGSVVGTSTVEAPVTARAVVEACEGKDPCNVGRLLGVAGFSYDAARTEVIKDELAKHPNIKVVQEVVYGYDPRRAQSATREMLTAHPEINVIEANGGIGALVASSVADQMGIDLLVVSQSGSREELEAVRDGSLFSTVGTYPEDMGARAAEIAIAAARDTPEQDAFIDAREAFGPADLLITRGNVDQFEAQYSQGPTPTG